MKSWCEKLGLHQFLPLTELVTSHLVKLLLKLQCLVVRTSHSLRPHPLSLYGLIIIGGLIHHCCLNKFWRFHML